MYIEKTTHFIMAIIFFKHKNTNGSVNPNVPHEMIPEACVFIRVPSEGGSRSAPTLPGHVHRKEREIEGGTAGKGRRNVVGWRGEVWFGRVQSP